MTKKIRRELEDYSTTIVEKKREKEKTFFNNADFG